jgi:hypothetical protein
MNWKTHTQGFENILFTIKRHFFLFVGVDPEKAGQLLCAETMVSHVWTGPSTTLRAGWRYSTFERKLHQSY